MNQESSDEQPPPKEKGSEFYFFWGWHMFLVTCWSLVVLFFLSLLDADLDRLPQVIFGIGGLSANIVLRDSFERLFLAPQGSWYRRALVLILPWMAAGGVFISAGSIIASVN